jgi:ferrous iron transport protein B
VRAERGETATLSDRIDRFATHRWLGIPLFLAAMWLVFKVTIDLSAPWVDWLDGVLSGPISRWTLALLDVLGLGQTWLASLAVDGVLAGVGSVLAFVPVLLSLYFALAVLEDSGYMARGAFVMDRLMSRMGLQGRSFLPLMVGFGCSVPAIYATRTLNNQRDRVLTGLLVPFMSCSARLPVYVLFAAVFFPGRAGLVILGLYLLGIIVALGIGLLLRRTLLPTTNAPGLVMELPPYRLPNARSIGYHMWQRTRGFLQHASSLILVTTLVIWLLTAIPVGGQGTFADTPVAESAFGRVSAVIAPAMEPLGFGSWEAGGALLSGLVAKEVVVSTMAQVYRGSGDAAEAGAATFLSDLAQIVTSFGRAIADTLRAIPGLVGIDLTADDGDAAEAGLAANLRAGFDKTSGGHAAAAGLAFMVFVLLYTPCMAAVAAERHELGSKWMWLSLLGQLAIAWVVALVVFQVGRLLGGG